MLLATTAESSRRAVARWPTAEVKSGRWPRALWAIRGDLATSTICPLSGRS